MNPVTTSFSRANQAEGEQANLFFQVVAQCYERGSMILTSHHGHSVSAPVTSVLQASLPQEHMTKEVPANSLRRSVPQ